MNNDYRQTLEKNGMVMAGLNPEKDLVEIIELDRAVHPFYMGTQGHPEYKSRPVSPHPIFLGFIEAVNNS